MDENIAGLLCYVLGWITGIIFYFIDKRPFVRFHAAQSIVVFAGIHIIYFVLAAFLGFSIVAGGVAGAGGFSLGFLLYPLIGLVSFILWILLMVKAYQATRNSAFRSPLISPRKFSACPSRREISTAPREVRSIPRGALYSYLQNCVDKTSAFAVRCSRVRALAFRHGAA